MIFAAARSSDGLFRLEISGHCDDAGICAAVTAFEQTAMHFLDQLAAGRPDDIEFMIMEATPV